MGDGGAGGRGGCGGCGTGGEAAESCRMGWCEARHTAVDVDHVVVMDVGLSTKPMYA